MSCSCNELLGEAAALIDDLSRAFQDNSFRATLQTYTDPCPLMIGEVGYLSYGSDAANALFHVVNERPLLRWPPYEVRL